MHAIPSESTYPWRQVILGNGALALAYLILGRLSLLLAIPPGYAMAIYPPAGLAVAVVLIAGYRLAPGVAIGSLLLNLWITWETQHSLSLLSCLLVTVIALGAMTQAVFGTWLVKKFLPTSLELNHHDEILKFMLLAGPFSCLVSASVGTCSLFVAGIMPAADVFGNWITWWGGDSLGVLVVTPIIFVLFAPPRPLWAGRRYSVLLPQILILFLMMATYISVRNWEQDRQAQEFKHRLQNIVHGFQSRLQAHVEGQKELATVFENFPKMSLLQFESIAAPLLQYKGELAAVEWAPKLMNAERKVFEVQHASSSQQAFAILERDQHKNMLVAATRDMYFPILYIAPIAGNERALGFDLHSVPNRRASIQVAIQYKRTVATEPLTIIQEKTGKLSTVLITAVRDLQMDKSRSQTHSENLDSILGIVVSVLRPSDVLRNLLSDQDRKEIKLKLLDVSSDPLKPEIFLDDLGKDINPADVSQKIEFGGRQWRLQARPSDAYLVQHRPWAAWISLIAGMLFSGLVGMYFLTISGRAFQIEALVVQRTRQLQESEENRLAILEHAADGILTVNANGLILSGNRAAEKSLDVDSSAISGATPTLSMDDLFLDEHGATLSFAQIIARTSHISKPLIEVQRRHSDFSLVSLELAIAKVTRQYQSIYIVVIHDLTERKRLDKIKGEFVSTVSHELRTPLTSIRGSLGLLNGGAVGEIPEAALKLIKLASNNAERLHQLINDILDFEKLEYGGMLFKMEAHRLIDQLHKAVEYNTGYAEKFSVKLNIVGEQFSDVYVNIDDNRYMQVLCNLISNAIKFSHTHGVVEIRVERMGDIVRVKICDHGIGIDAAFSQQIFKKFTQGDSSVTRKHSGTGLGLSLAKSMIEKMGGSIGFSSVLGEGSIFYIDMKIADVRSGASFSL
jgi:PAS domain S-box-containing protein